MNFRNLIFTLCLLLCGTFSGLQAQSSSSSSSSSSSGGGSSEPPRMETIEAVVFCNEALVEKVLDKKDIEYTRRKDNLYKIKLKGYSVSLLIDDGDIILRTYFSDSKPSLQTLNDFNANYRWGRTYFDSDNDLTYAAELSFTGGIAEEGIHIFLNTYGALLEKLVETIN